MSGITVYGIKRPMEQLENMQLNLSQAMNIAVKRALRLVKEEARLILEQEQTNNWPDKDGVMRSITEGDLWRRFRIAVVRSFGLTVGGELTNTDPAAPFLEFGTHAHNVTPVNAEQLGWWEAEGVRAYSKGHEVSGIAATRFLSLAVERAYPAILEDFALIMKKGGFSGNPAATAIFLASISTDYYTGTVSDFEA